MIQYGHYTEDGMGYVITRPDTPRPWVNCLTNGAYSAIVSQTGGGYSFIGGPGYDRITRADPDIATSDRPGRYIYIKDNNSGEFFSIGWQPVKREPDWYECIHEPGVTTIASTSLGITGRITFFVPLDDNLEIWKVRLENNRNTPIDISIFAYVEWVLGNYMDDLEDRQIADLFNSARFQDNYIVATKRAWRRPDSGSITLKELKPAGGPRFLPETVSSNQAWGKWAFIAMSLPVDSYDCSKEAFLGRYGDISSPRAVKEGTCTNSEGNGREAIGALQTRIVLEPGQHLDFSVFVGITMHDADPSGVWERYSDHGVVDEKLEAVREYWDLYAEKLTISTPDQEMDRAVNIWDKYQCWVSIRTSGLTSLYKGGESVIGFRESCYDILGALPIDSEYCKLHVVNLMQHQYKDGSTVHYWEPRSNVGVRTGQLDDPLWMVFALISYLKETGDLAFLDDRIKYYYSQSPATVYEHMIKALDFCLSQLSPRGLSLLGPGDWDDALDQAGRDGRGESILTSQMLCWVLLESAEMAKQIKDRSQARTWLSKAADIGRAVNEVAWDGKWYIRATTDSTDIIGEKKSSTAKIFLNTQSWAIISEMAPVEQALTSMESVRKHLETPDGPALLLPAYTKSDRRIGTLTRYSPGMKENGGVSTLAAAWAIMAECKLGNGSRAYQIFRKTLYSARGKDPERYKVEPYVHAGWVAGPNSDSSGLGAFTWTQGTAAWMWRTCIDWICGVRPDYEGLRIDPCVPSDWTEFTVIRPFREAIYKIHVLNPDGVEKGVLKITVDGKKAKPDAPIHDCMDGKVHEVEVIMGSDE